ncbi:hypothetical protein AKJ09_03060 [Labilithrix luteola]|uniref:Lipoprotein n=1 Tax=Labilithrix luteola TaxID=1391654 RepID=A0A0K1PSQ3_9BACT|nr:hypothetical protein [Labilithrix luteola]AKU96396.1 hypothetical protein AKJ09_03060 [Labilithrix luteola]
MIRSRLRPFAVSFSLLVAACGDETPKPVTPADVSSTADAGAAPSSESVATPNAKPDGGAATYRLVVSFISLGAGVDSKAKDQVNEVINKWRIAKSVDLKTERVRWGKEGESDVCSGLDELSDADRSKFIGEVRAAVGKNDRVVITENASCHETR